MTTPKGRIDRTDGKVFHVLTTQAILDRIEAIARQADSAMASHDEKHLRNTLEIVADDLTAIIAAARVPAAAVEEADAIAVVSGSDVVLGRETRSLHWLTKQPFMVEPGTKLYAHPRPTGDVVPTPQQISDYLAGLDLVQREVTTREARALSGPMVEHADDLAVDAFAIAMKAKLAEARAKGRGGWNDKAACTAQTLSRMLRDHVEKGDPPDVANFSMFLHQRGESIEPYKPASLLELRCAYGPEATADQAGEAVAFVAISRFSGPVFQPLEGFNRLPAGNHSLYARPSEHPHTRPMGGVPNEWLSDQIGGEFDDMTSGQGYRRGWNDCRRAMLAVTPEVLRG